MASTQWIFLRACISAILAFKSADAISLRGRAANAVQSASEAARQESSTSIYEDFSRAVDPAVEALLGRGSASIPDAIKNGAAALDLQTALATAKLPRDIMQMLAVLTQSTKKSTTMEPKEGIIEEAPLIKEPEVKNTLTFDEASVMKALKTLNDMVAASQVQLDQKSIECQEFDESNRKTAYQVQTDLDEIGAMITTLNGKKSATIAAQLKADEDGETLIEQQGKAAFEHKTRREADEAQLAIHKADLAVTKFMLDTSKCEDADYKASLLQATDSSKSTEVEMCTENGTASFKFMDPRLESYKARLTAKGQQLLNFVLENTPHVGSTSNAAKAETYALRAASLAYGDGLEDLDDGDDSNDDALSAMWSSRQLNLARINSSMKQSIKGQVHNDPLREGSIEESKQAKRCANLVPDCGLLHDTMANLWGDMKDLVENLEMKMSAEEKAWNQLNDGFNVQQKSLTVYKGQLQTTLSEVSAFIQQETEAQGKKEIEKKELDGIYRTTMMECQQTLKQILYTEICGTITVRNELLVNGKGLKHEDILDCEFTGWTSAGCSVPCDDKMVGGIEFLSREIMQQPTELYGAACPVLNMTKKCNQFKCPIDCALTEWSGWSKCSVECGGGVQSHSRTIDVRPKNAGKACDILQESQTCNSDTCYRNCELSKWSEPTPCSKACDTGFTYKEKSVTLSERGGGICWEKDDPERYVREDCNTQACVGDEICIGKMDVVIAIDASGSLTQAGFTVLQDFTVEILKRLRGAAYGSPATRVAVIQFGNGHLDSMGVVSNAHLIQGLSYDIEATKEAIQGLKWQRGFTNMAQALLASKKLLKGSERTDAKGVAVLITDGKASFERQTEEAATALKETSTLMVVQVKKSANKETQAFLKDKIVSQPWDTNFISIPGKKILKADYGKFAGNVLVEMCSNAESPSLIAKENEKKGYILKAAGMMCMDAPTDKSYQQSIEECEAKAEGFAWDTFAWNPNSFYWGKGECLVFTKECTSYWENFNYNTYTKLI